MWLSSYCQMESLMLLSVCPSPGLAVGLDPEGYGNPDFCWLSMYDTLIWSFAGPIAMVASVSQCKKALNAENKAVCFTVYCCGIRSSAVQRPTSQPSTLSHGDLIRAALQSTPVTVQLNYCQRVFKENSQVHLKFAFTNPVWYCVHRWTSSCTSCRPEPPAHWDTTASRRKSLVCECPDVFSTVYMLPALQRYFAQVLLFKPSSSGRTFIAWNC